MSRFSMHPKNIGDTRLNDAKSEVRLGQIYILFDGPYRKQNLLSYKKEYANLEHSYYKLMQCFCSQ